MDSCKKKGPPHEKTCFIPYANNKGADQPAHSCSLISTFVVHCLDSIIPILAIPKISRLQLISVAEQLGLSLTWSQTPDDRFSCYVAQKRLHFRDIGSIFKVNMLVLDLVYPVSGKPDLVYPVSRKPDLVYPVCRKPDLVYPVSRKPLVILIKLVQVSIRSYFGELDHFTGHRTLLIFYFFFQNK